jgi:hypothetical protein
MKVVLVKIPRETEDEDDVDHDIMFEDLLSSTSQIPLAS